MPSPIIRFLGPIAMAGVVLTAPLPVLAQDGADEARLRKIESEIRAIQRRVFPGGDGKFFEPQISPAQQANSTATTPSTTAVTDILARLDAIEAQLQQLTARSEENANAIAGLETRVTALEPKAPVMASTLASTGTSPTAGELPAANPGTAVAPKPAAMTSQPAASAPAAAGPSAARLAAVKEIAKPQTDDAADDEYSYGYRLWNAGFFPEAQQQLSMYVEKNPSHWRLSYARNLLGRAYLDDGKAREAAPWFLRNYQSDKQGARAGDSLLYLAEAMIALGDTNRACIALAEFSETYPALATGRLLDQYEANRKKVKCN